MIQFKIVKKKRNTKVKSIRNGAHNVYGKFAGYKFAGIYFIKCCITNKYYIGSTKNITARVIKHFSELYLNKHTNKRMLEDYNKYGDDNFSFGIIEQTDIDLIDKEREYQIQYGIDNIYNEKVSGYYITDELKKVYSSTSKSSHKTKEYREKMSKIKSNKIGQYIIDLKGNLELIRTYENMNEVIEHNPTFKPQPIRGVCNGSKRSAYGYRWKYLL